MSIEALIAFTIAMTILCATPGPGFFTIIATSLNKGMPAAFAVLVGITLGDLVYLTIALIGLEFLAQTLGSSFYLAKYAAGAYLFFLGYKAWKAHAQDTTISREGSRQLLKSFFVGLAVTIGNPKVMFFYLALLPTFVNLEDLSNTDITIIISIVVLVTFIVEGFYIVTARKIQEKFSRESTSTLPNKITGSLLMLAGLAVALQN
ncbi:LysE family translocator [Temperatibacter marinus]|uniref:LysE family translocator n=1 Tax=Temperatibacter marinus TaxID=1456591 RepID=A0AA52H947_9PROT|nr:LysE family translocator [Temperatibacter marinus]WND02137.1 LysE family translocator [Temperatibacter marinus]